MRMTIKELKAKGEKDDKVKFSGKIKNVYDAKEAVTKYTVSRQNIIVEDNTDTIKVIVSHKKKEDEYTKDIVGKEIEVDGKISIWEGKINIFGKLIFKEEEAPKQEATISAAGKATRTSTMPVTVEIRKESLKLAMQFWTARIGDKMEENKLMKTADIFYTYLIGKAIIAKPKVQEEGKVSEIKEGKTEVLEEISPAKVTLINEIMSLKESQRVVDEVFKGYCDGEDIKTLTIEKLQEIKKKLNEQTDEIPF